MKFPDDRDTRRRPASRLTRSGLDRPVWRRFLALAGSVLPFAALSGAQVVPGDYGDTAIAFDPASGSLTGCHESFRIGNGSASSPQFGCSFFFVGQQTRRGGAPRFRIEASSDPEALSRGDSEASGMLAFPGERVRLRFARDELPGCRSVQDLSDLSAELKQRQEWLRIGMLSAGAPFRRAPANAAAAMDFQATNDQLVYVRERRNCWLYVTHHGPRNPVPSSARLGDDPVTRGWVHASALHPATAAENACRQATVSPDRAGRRTSSPSASCASGSIARTPGRTLTRSCRSGDTFPRSRELWTGWAAGWRRWPRNKLRSWRNDLYGRTTVILDRRTLEEGVLRARMTNVEYVELKFRPGALR